MISEEQQEKDYADEIRTYIASYLLYPLYINSLKKRGLISESTKTLDIGALEIFLKDRKHKVINELGKQLNQFQGNTMKYSDIIVNTKERHPLGKQFYNLNNVYNYMVKFKDEFEVLPKLTSEMIERVYEQEIPNEETVRNISHTIQLVQEVCKRFRSVEICPMGSVANGLYLNSSSDIDLSRFYDPVIL